MRLYEIIKERRILLHLTQQDLADITGVSLRTIKLIESSEGNPSVDTLSRLGQALGLELIFQIRKTGKL
jgi:Predicted transcriptional regulators